LYVLGPALPLPRGFVRGLNFFAVCYGLRLAHLREFLRPLFYDFVCRKIISKTASFSQFPHSLDVKPCTLASKIDEAKKILMATRETPWHRHTLQFVKIFSRVTGGTSVVHLTRLSKILIPYGDLDRPDKLGNSFLIARLDGHQNFSRANRYA